MQQLKACLSKELDLIRDLLKEETTMRDADFHFQLIHLTTINNGGRIMEFRIKLTIQEIVDDFEKLIRYDEHLEVLFDNEKADKLEIEKFYNNIVEMIEKYIPNYKKHVEGDISEVNYENALKLYKMLYENFKEIFYKLV